MQKQLQVIPVCPRVEVIARCAVRHVSSECDSDLMRLRRRAVTVRTASLEMLNIAGAVSRPGP